MREVKLAYRLHITELLSGRQWYFGESEDSPEGFIWYDKEEPSTLNYSCPRLLFDIEEYEINPEEDHVCNH